MLDFSQTLALIKQAQSNDELAKEKLVVENSPLIKSVIKRYKNKGIEYDDLYQLGSMGFLKAVQNFKEEFNVKFSTYAVPMIAGEIKRYLRDNGIIKVSRSVKTLCMQINKFIEEEISINNKTPSVEVIAQHFNITNQEVIFAMESSVAPISFSTTIGKDEDTGRNLTIIDKVECETSIEKNMDNFLLTSIIKTLEPRDKKIILLRYFRGKTQKEIAKEMGVSQVQISRLETKILEKIKIKMAE